IIIIIINLAFDIALFTLGGHPKALHRTHCKICNTWGSGGFRTFEDKFYYLSSECKFVMSRQCKDSSEDFNVQIRRGSNGILEHIFMKIEGVTIIVDEGIISVKDQDFFQKKLFLLTVSLFLIYFSISLKSCLVITILFLLCEQRHIIASYCLVQGCYQTSRCEINNFYISAEYICPGNQIYNKAGSSCVQTCTDPNPLLHCDNGVITCDCPKGTVLNNIKNNNQCIDIEQCPCVFGGVIFEPGETRNTSCQSCTCKSGNWNCFAFNCPGRCKFEEGTYITTFDQKCYNLRGDCSYIAASNLFFTGEIIIFQQCSMFIQFATTFGLKMQVQISPIMQLYISLPTDAQGTTTGLCGNFNGNADDDFTSSQQIIEPTSVAFAQSWEIGDCTKERDPPSCISSENGNVPIKYCLLLQYRNICKETACVCQNIDECICAALGAYAHECAAHGIIVADWNGDTCTKCPETQVFGYDMRACNRTCRSLSDDDYTCEVEDVPVYGCGCPQGKYMNENQKCVESKDCACYKKGIFFKPGYIQISSFIKNQTMKIMQNMFSFTKPSKCVPGCACPEGLVENDKGECVQLKTCTCSWGGEIYSAGSTINQDCNKCTCENGEWKCSKKLCPKTCEVYGEGHYKTFDGKRYAFDGNCRYIYVEDQCKGELGSFQIITESLPCCEKGVICSRSDKEVILKEDEHINCTDDFCSVYTVGLYLVLTFSDGITVTWDKRTRLSVTLDPRWKDKVCGLCGNFNLNTEDDLTTKGNYLVADVVEFGNSWKADSMCSDVSEQKFPCERNPYCEAWAHRKCGIIKESTFQHCHKKVDNKPYYDACIQEACACDMEGKYLGFCTSVAVYAEACNKAGVCIDWRTPDLCRKYQLFYS
uniref:VWFD domain-containing protein n=1 Tax=Callorhinchus milii TaxID=7868 RepID=A0A4W3J9K4_CALMI